MRIDIDKREAKRLCRLAARGDEKAYELLYSLTRPYINFLRRKFGNVLSPDDLGQRLALLLRYEVAPSYDPSKGTFSAFVSCVFRRKISTEIKALAVRQRAFAGSFLSLDLRGEDSEGDATESMGDSFASDNGSGQPFGGMVAAETCAELLEALSSLERVVFLLRVQNVGVPDFYSRIADTLLTGVPGLFKPIRGQSKARVVKRVDNALQRIKVKAARLRRGEPIERTGHGAPAHSFPLLREIGVAEILTAAGLEPQPA